MAVTQGLLADLIADAAPERLRGTAFGIYDTAVGAVAFIASSAAVAVIILLLFQPKAVLADSLPQAGRS